jgi:hypothetical protein
LSIHSFCNFCYRFFNRLIEDTIDVGEIYSPFSALKKTGISGCGQIEHGLKNKRRPLDLKGI